MIVAFKRLRAYAAISCPPSCSFQNREKQALFVWALILSWKNYSLSQKKSPNNALTKSNIRKAKRRTALSARALHEQERPKNNSFITSN